MALEQQGTEQWRTGNSWFTPWSPTRSTEHGSRWRHARTKSLAVAKEDALQPIGLQFLQQYWLSRSSKVDDFYLTWKSVFNFLLVINSNLRKSVSDDRRQSCHRDLQLCCSASKHVVMLRRCTLYSLCTTCCLTTWTWKNAPVKKQQHG